MGAPTDFKFQQHKVTAERGKFHKVPDQVRQEEQENE